MSKGPNYRNHRYYLDSRMNRAQFLKGVGQFALLGLAGSGMFLQACTRNGTQTAPPAAPATSVPAQPEPAAAATSADKGPIVLDLYGGAFEEAFKTHVIPKFTQETGIEVIVRPGAGSKIPQWEAMVKSGKVETDVATTDKSDSLIGKRMGLFHQLDPKLVPNFERVYEYMKDPDRYFVASIVYWTVMFYRTDKIANPPDSWEALWDPQYEGWVSVLNDVGWSNILPITAATLGIKQDELRNKEALDRVWAKLDGLKKQIRRWWTGGADWQQMVAGGEAHIGTAWNGRVFDSQDKGVPVDAIWPKEGAYLANDNWVIIQGTKHPEAAQRWVNFVLEPEIQAAIAKELSFGPTTMGTADLLPEDVRHRTFGPPGAIDRAIPEDWSWYLDQADELQARWAEWIAS